MEGAIQFLVVATIVWTAIASSSVDVWNIPIGRAARWVALALLCAFALVYVALRPRPRLDLDRWFALAVAFPVLAVLSALWSPIASTTAARGLTVVVLFATAGAIAVGVAGRVERAGQVLLGVLAAAVIVAVLGLVHLWNDPDSATVPATIGTPLRYNGLGGNPNTMSMLLALAMPLVVWVAVEARTWWGRTGALAMFALLDLSIAASGSRGAILAAFAGMAAFAFSSRSRRAIVLLLGVAFLTLVVNAALTRVPQPAERDPVLNPEFGTREPIAPGDAQFILPLESEIGFPPGVVRAKPRQLLDTSGRLTAWEGAVRQAAERPVAGYGFGTEERVFADRFFGFTADRVENAFVATVLQLGAVGGAVFVALLAMTLRRGIRQLRLLDGHARRVVGAALGVFCAGLALSATQSFTTSVGSPATVPFWLAALFLGTAAVLPSRARRALRP